MKIQSSLSWDLNEIRTSYETIMSTEGCQRLEPEKLKQRFRSGPRGGGLKNPKQRCRFDHRWVHISVYGDFLYGAHPPSPFTSPFMP